MIGTDHQRPREADLPLLNPLLPEGLICHQRLIERLPVQGGKLIGGQGGDGQHRFRLN